MIRMTDKIAGNLTSAADTCRKKLFVHQPLVPDRALYDAVYTEDEQQTLTKAIGLMMVGCVSADSYPFNAQVEFKHETLPSEVTIKDEFSFVLYPRTPIFHGVLPRQMDTNIPLIKEAMADHVERMYIAAMIKSTVVHLTKNCNSLEAMRYLFPPTLTLLRLAGEEELATKVEEVRRAPTLPATTTFQRKCIRFLNTWFACQELLGTFYVDEQEQNNGFKLDTRSGKFGIGFTDPDTTQRHEVGFLTS